MRDRRRRTDLLLPRERQSTDDNNPFAPPPEGRPDQPWQPRRPANNGSEGSSGSSGSSDDSSGSGSDGSGSPGDRPAWGSQWSSRQPGRSGGGFGGRPDGQNTQNDSGGRQGGPDGEPPAPGLRAGDPTDPAQRRARYALLSGMWAFFFALFDFPEIALLLGALALYWAISSLRGKAQRRPVDPTSPPPAAPPVPQTPSRSQITAAVSGLVMASIALVVVAASFTAQLVYRDYYTCVDDALTKSGQLACNDMLPDPLRGIIGVKE